MDATDNLMTLSSELERLFDLEELRDITRDLLGVDPEEVGGGASTSAYAKSLISFCAGTHRIPALCDAVLAVSEDVDEKVADIARHGVASTEELAPGQELGDYLILRRLGRGQRGIVYLARQGDTQIRLKVLHPSVTSDPVGLMRFLTANRIIATLGHPGLPRGIVAGEHDGKYFVASRFIDGQTLATRVSRAGALHLEDARGLFRRILEPLAALHARRVAHGDLRPENVLVADDEVVLLDVGSHFLSIQPAAANGHSDRLLTLGSPKTLAPEQIDGHTADARSDMYSFGALAYEVLTAYPVFEGRTGAERLIGHLTREPQLPSLVAPAGWVTPDVDDFITGLLSKDPARRVSNAESALASLDSLGSETSLEGVITGEELEGLVRALMNNPGDDFAEEALLQALRRGADVSRVAHTFRMASELVDTDQSYGRVAQHRLLHRSAKIYETSLRELETAEKMYMRLVALGPTDAEAATALERVRRQLGKHDEIVEAYLERAEQATTAEEKAGILAEIGRLYETELDDAEQALVAYTQAFCEDPLMDDYAQKVARLAGKSHPAWNEVMSSCLEASVSVMPQDQKTALLLQMGDWYLENIGRADLAMPCYQAVLAVEPNSVPALDGITKVLRRAQQWSELGQALLMRAAAPSTSGPMTRDLRAEAGEILATRLGKPDDAAELWEDVVKTDPTHEVATDCLLKLYEANGEFDKVVRLLERRADAEAGDAQLDTIFRIGEVHELRLKDLAAAVRRYRSVVSRDPRHLDALHGLDRCLSQQGDFDDLIDNLQMQIEAAATPRQKMHLWERVAAVWDEEFLNHERAAEAWENVLDLDGNHEEALNNLVRHYRSMDRHGEVSVTLEKHIGLLRDQPERRLEKLLTLGHVLADQLKVYDRALKAFEEALELSPQNSEALEAIAGLRVETGETAEALAALENLARDASDPKVRAEHYVRAARLLEGRGDKDGAIERYKLAVDANPNDRALATILRAAYIDRGDVSAAAELLEREIDRTEGESARGKLAGELAALYLDRVDNEVRAESWAKVSLESDPTNLEGLRVMGDLAHRAKRHREAVRYYEQVGNRTDAMTQPEAVRVLLAYSDSLVQVEQGKRAVAVVEKLVKTAPDQARVLGRAAELMFEHGDAQRSFDLHWEYLHRARQDLPDAAVAAVLYRMGESARRAGDLAAAKGPLEESIALDPTKNPPLKSLAELHAARNAWEDSLRVMYRQLDNLQGEDRVELLLEIGDLAAKKLKEPDYAAKSYLAALGEKPNDRKILTKLMQLYSQEKDWDRLVRVILKLADFVDDTRQKAKYLHTAGRIAYKEMNDAMRGSQLMQRSLELDPDNLELIDEALDVHNKAQNAEALKELLKRRVKVASDKDDKTMLLGSLTALAELYLNHFHRLEQAVAVYEGAQEIEDSVERREVLAQLYARDGNHYFDRAVAAYEEILSRDPFRPEAHRTLRRLYTDRKRPDPAWCCCQTLYVLGQAEPDEERFFLRMQGEEGANAKDRLRETDFHAMVVHKDANPLVTALFTIVEPAVIAVRSKPLPQLGFNREHLVDPSQHQFAVAQTIPYAADVLGQACPPMLQNPNDYGELGFVPSQPPAILLGTSVVGVALPPQTALYMAARHLTYFRSGFYIRQLVPTSAGLKAWLFAAIHLTSPGFPIPNDLASQVAEAARALEKHVTGGARDQLQRAVGKLLSSGALDLRKWTRGVDLTADRAGFLMSDDLQTAVELVRASDPRSSSVDPAARVEQLYGYAVSAQYFDARQKLSITIDS